MPRGDRTGPAGQGPLTGRGAGFCAGFSVPGFINLTPGRFPKRGRGLRWRRMLWAGMLAAACTAKAVDWAQKSKTVKTNNR